MHIPTSDIISWYQETNRIMLFYASGHVICLEVCPQLDDPSDDVTDQCRDIIKRLQNVNPTIVEVSVMSVCWCICLCVHKLINMSEQLSLCTDIM